MASPFEFFQQGNLSAAIAEASARVRAAPGDTTARLELIGYLCFRGDEDRIEKHLGVILTQAQDLAGEVLLYRGLVKGEVARRQCFEEGRVPRFTEPPEDYVKEVLRAMTLSATEPSEARALLESAAQRGETLSGEIDGVPFQGFRDLDDFTAMVIEVITMGGEYYWLPLHTVQSIRFEELAEPRDVVWRPGELVSRTGESVKGYFPGLYAGSHRSGDTQLMIGAGVETNQDGDGPLRGVGGKLFLAAGEPRPLATVQHITFEG